MCYPVYGMVHIKEPLLLIGKSSYVVAASFLSRYLNGPLPYVRRHITVNNHIQNLPPLFAVVVTDVVINDVAIEAVAIVFCRLSCFYLSLYCPCYLRIAIGSLLSNLFIRSENKLV